MVADAIAVDVRPHLFAAGDFRRQGKGFQNRAGILKAATEVVDFAATRLLREAPT